MKVLLFLNLLLSIISILPNWNLEYSSRITLDSNTNTYTYTACQKEMYNLNAKLNKTIKRTEEGTITHENRLYINNVDYGLVPFEQIESLYDVNNNKILCPMGKFDTFKINSNNLEQINNNIDKLDNWDIKCYYHSTTNFLVFYFNNWENQGFILRDGTYHKYQYLQLHRELYDFKLSNSNVDSNLNGGKYPICALINWNNHINFFGTEFTFPYNSELYRSPDISKELIPIKAYSQAKFNPFSNDFYYFTYNNAYDFSSGYSIRTVSGTNYYNTDVDVKNNFTTPFEFVDNVKIEEMKFLLYTNYAYYTIQNLKTGKKYHGILEVRSNRIMFNTNEDIDVFIPYSTYSMLAITKDKAYEICIIKDSNGNCISQCPSGQSIILDIDGNKCETNCESDQYHIIPENVCSYECDTSIYIIKGNICGLCRDVESTNKYKLVNGTECINEQPENSYIFNADLFLCICNNGYIANGAICIPHCYETCETCSDYSTNVDEQKCLTCKEGYYLDSDDSTNCKKIIPTTIPTTIPIKIPTTIPIQIPTTIPAKTPTTIVTTILTTVPNIIITSIPTTILTKIPTTITTTIPIIIPKTLPVTIPKLECPDEKCLTCNEASNKHGLCLSCNEAKGYKKVNYTIVLTNFLDCIKDEDPKFKNYYFNEITQEYRPCYKTFKTCLKTGNPDEHNCLECEKGYMFRPGNSLYIKYLSMPRRSKILYKR